MSTLDRLARQFSIEELPPPSPTDPPAVQTFTALNRFSMMLTWQVRAQTQVAKLADPEHTDARPFFASIDRMRAMIERADLRTLQFSVAGEMLRDVIVATFVAATGGVKLHDPNIQKQLLALGKITTGDLEDDYRRRIGMFQAIAKMGEAGALKPIQTRVATLGKGIAGVKAMADAMIAQAKAGGQLQGLGAVQLLPLIAVTAIVAIAFLIWALADTYQKNKILKDTCFAPGAQLTAQQLELCKKLVGGPDTWINTALWIGAAGVGVFLAIQFLPQIVSRVKTATQRAAA